MRLRILAMIVVTLVTLVIAPPAVAAPPDWISTAVTKDFANHGATKVLDLRYAAHDNFEGQVTFAFALRHRADYRIQHLSGPSRLVIDFRHR